MPTQTLFTYFPGPPALGGCYRSWQHLSDQELPLTRTSHQHAHHLANERAHRPAKEHAHRPAKERVHRLTEQCARCRALAERTPARCIALAEQTPALPGGLRPRFQPRAFSKSLTWLFARSVGNSRGATQPVDNFAHGRGRAARVRCSEPGGDAGTATKGYGN